MPPTLACCRETKVEMNQNITVLSEGVTGSTLQHQALSEVS